MSLNEEKLKERASNSVSGMNAYYICEFCEWSTTDQDKMIKHLVENHKKELEEADDLDDG